MTSKVNLRRKAKIMRKTLQLFKKSALVVAQIRENSSYKSANNVLIYYPLQYELNLLALLDDGKNFYLPRVCRDKLLICPFKKGEKLEKSEFNVCEPCSSPINPQNLDLVVVPALMADKKGYRLGYGGGFYDKFLAQNKGIKTILPIAKELFVNELPHENFDVPVDEVLVV